MNGQFTPGPWLVGEQRRIYAGDYYNVCVAQTFKDPQGSAMNGIGRDEAEDNAQLISAVTDLYNALEALLSVVVEREQGNHDLDEELDAAEAALAKAIRKP